MEVGIDRILNFVYRGDEDIEGFRRILQDGGPPDQSVSISLRRWKKMLDPHFGFRAHTKELISSNPVEAKIHLGGLFYAQISQRYANVQLRQHFFPKDSTKIQPTTMGVAMSIPEYCYFETLLDEFNRRIPALASIVPCYKQSIHSNTCLECFPVKKKNLTRDSGFGGGKRFMNQLANRRSQIQK